MKPVRMPPRRLAAAGLVFAALCACGKPEPPEKEQPPEPQAGHSALTEAIQRPIDKAKQADADVQKAAAAQRKAIEDAGG